MTNVELYIDCFPDYKFYGIEIEHNKYFGEVMKDKTRHYDIYKYVTAGMPIITYDRTQKLHAAFDVFGDDKRSSLKTLLAEKQTEYVANNFQIKKPPTISK